MEEGCLDYEKFFPFFTTLMWFSDHSWNHEDYKRFMDMTREEVQWRDNYIPGKRFDLYDQMLKWRLSLSDEEWEQVLVAYKISGYDGPTWFAD